jgi:hypothetical protein
VPCESGGDGEQWCERLHPPKDGDVIDLHAGLSPQFLDVAIRQAVPLVPPHRQHDDLGRKPKACEG